MKRLYLLGLLAVMFSQANSAKYSYDVHIEVNNADTVYRSIYSELKQYNATIDSFETFKYFITGQKIIRANINGRKKDIRLLASKIAGYGILYLYEYSGGHNEVNKLRSLENKLKSYKKQLKLEKKNKKPDALIVGLLNDQIRSSTQQIELIKRQDYRAVIYLTIRQKNFMAHWGIPLIALIIIFIVLFSVVKFTTFLTLKIIRLFHNTRKGP